jgi:hypothetical protein
MANKLYDEAAVQDIANAIREKNGTDKTYTIAEMGEAVRDIVSAGEGEYKGDYTVIPDVEAQTLETKQKLMTDNVTIKEIPYYDTSNLAGGITVYIGSTLDE